MQAWHCGISELTCILSNYRLLAHIQLLEDLGLGLLDKQHSSCKDACCKALSRANGP